MRFKFPFETLMKERRIRRDEAERVFRLAQHKVDEQRDLLTQYRDGLKVARADVGGVRAGGGKLVGALSSYEDFIEGQKIRIQRQHKTVKSLEEVAEQKRILLVEANKDLKALVKEGRFLAHAVQLTGLDLQVRTNQNLRPDPNGYKPMPQELLSKVSLPIVVDRVLVENSKLRFENIWPGKTEFGTITFDPLDITITNVTNDSARIAQQKTMRMDAVAKCQGKHRVQNTFWFDLSSPNSAFNFKGGATEFPFLSLNSFIKPYTNIAFEGGTIHKLLFEANGNANSIDGKLSMDYEGLDIALLDEERKKRRLLSKVVDVLFVNEDNDNSGEDFNKGEMHARRDMRLSFINFWWKSIQSGIKTSLLEDSTLERIDKFAKKRKKRKARKMAN